MEALVHLLIGITLFAIILLLTVFISNTVEHVSSINLLEKISHIYALTMLFILLLQNEVT